MDSAARLVASHIVTPSPRYEDFPNASADIQSQPASHVQRVASQGNDPFNTTKSSVEAGLSLGGINVLSKMNIGRGLSPVARHHSDSHDFDPYERQGSEADAQEPSEDMIGSSTTINSEAPNAPLRKPRPLQSNNAETGAAKKPGPSSLRARMKVGSDASDSHNPFLIGTNKRTISGSNPVGAPSTGALGPPQRRSIRIFNRGPSSAKGSAAAANSSMLGPGRELKKVRAGAPKPRIFSNAAGREGSGDKVATEAEELLEQNNKPLSARLNPDVELEHEAMHWLLRMFDRLGQGYYHLSRFQCQDAMKCFQSVTAQQRDTPWVLGQMGRAYFEQSQYAEAAKVFARIKKMAPSRIEDMEVYSTVLWHLKNDTELAFLSHELVEADRLAPQSWCTIGNSFSLQRDHDQALRCFKRATQLDPKFAYGYTLQGHEHMSNEEYDKALQAYRKAISADHRHYNGWYGLGKVYEKMGQYDMAEKHYRAAAYINPTNAILVTCIGVVSARDTLA